jgi:hypothetical protein
MGVIPPKCPQSPVSASFFSSQQTQLCEMARMGASCSHKMFLYRQANSKVDQSYCVYSARTNDEQNRLRKNSFAMQKFFAAPEQAAEAMIGK